MIKITGSIYPRGGNKWELTAELPRDPVTNKRNRRYKTVRCSSKKEAQKALRDFLGEIESGMYVATDRTTVSQWLKTWMDVYAIPNDSPTTVSRYWEMIHRYIDTTIGKMALQDLNAVNVQAWVNGLKKSPVSGKPMSATTIRKTYNVLKPALDKAVLNGIIAKTPCVGITLPKGEKKAAVVYDQDQIKQLRAAAKGTDMELVIDMELCLGMRRGELLGLQWRDIDWETKKISIVRTRVLVGTEPIIKQPKTETSKRILDLPDPLLQKLRQYKADCAAQRLRSGKRFTNNDYIFVHPNGEPIYPEYMTQKFTKIQEKAGLPHCRFHDLRHLCASIMLMQGINVKSAQEILGHKDVHTTLNIYSHVMPSSLKEASDKIGSFVYDTTAV